MVTLNSADSVLKSFYLDAVAESLNTKTNPFLAQIERTSADVTGKDVRKAVRIGVNGGIGAGTETGDLPAAHESDYKTFVATLKNLYGTIEISDKAIRASANNEGAFVNLLNEEMQALVKSASFNFGRMLFGDGSGALATVQELFDGGVYVDDVSALVEGMYVDIGTTYEVLKNGKITKVDRANKAVYINLPGDDITGYANSGMALYLHGSVNNDITGLEALFGDGELYGMSAEEREGLLAYQKASVGAISESVIQNAIDSVEENSGCKVDFIICSWGVRRALVEYYKQYNIVLPTIKIEGGFTALDFNGIPLVVDRFCPKGTMYLLNTESFKLHQLCDWQWLEAEDGKILKQVPGKPVYTATLVKYAELMCENPKAQAKLSGITEA